MREDARYSVPACISVAPCSEPSRPSPAGGRHGRQVLTAPARGALRLLQAGAKERPLLARTKELYQKGKVMT